MCHFPEAGGVEGPYLRVAAPAPRLVVSTYCLLGTSRACELSLRGKYIHVFSRDVPNRMQLLFALISSEVQPSNLLQLGIVRLPDAPA